MGQLIVGVICAVIVIKIVAAGMNAADKDLSSIAEKIKRYIKP